jgi:FMN phosphatase YigB (HAD superfamily)
MTDYERGYHQGKADALATQNPASCINRSDIIRMAREGYRQGYADAMNWKTQNHLEHLPGREWVGLTDKEIKSLPSWWPSYEDAPALIQLVKDVEAKLKEKNA